jgi:hypothetical protein
VPKADSIRSLVPYDTVFARHGLSCHVYRVDCGYFYEYQDEYLNLGSIRNQGWETQASANAGPFSVRGTYSWTKSRVIGVTPKWRAQMSYTADFQVGRPFDYLPEHTWAMTLAYARTATNVLVTLNGSSQAYTLGGDRFTIDDQYGIRLLGNVRRMNIPEGYHAWRPGYTTADLNASRQISSAIEGVVQIHNLTNFYQNDVSTGFPTMGRQTNVGLRLRFQ